MTVLIVTHPDDIHADAVQEHLSRLAVDVYRTDTATLGQAGEPVTGLLRQGKLIGYLAGCDLSMVTCVWHRRPSHFTATGAPNLAELRAGIGGLLAGLPHLNHPADMARAALKPFQLVTAAECGLRVPETMISTELPMAEEFAQRCGMAVVKPMSRTVPGIVRPYDRTGWGRAMHLTQQTVRTREFVRLTVVDDEMLAARIVSDTLDWRDEGANCRFQHIEVPDTVAGPVRALMRRLRLRFATLDFAEDLDWWWFLEANPNGQWLWVEQALGLPISIAVARALAVPVVKAEPAPH